MISIKHVTLAVAAIATVALSMPATAEDTAVVKRRNGATSVDAPTTRVAVRESTGDTRVRVRAPSTNVDVDTDRREVRIRVPYFSGDIRW